MLDLKAHISSRLEEIGPAKAALMAAVAAGYVYLFLPFLLVFAPTEGFFLMPAEGSLEARPIWEMYEGSNLPNPGQRRYFFRIIPFVGSTLTGMTPWQVFQVMIVVTSIVSVWLTYLFVRHFTAITPGRFLVLALAFPFWVISLQYVHDSGMAYTAFIAALYFAVRGGIGLLIAAALAVLAIFIRPDAIPIFGIAMMVIWVDRDTLGRRIGDCAVFAVAFVVVGTLFLAYFDMTFVEYITPILRAATGLKTPGYRLDVFIKVFTINGVILAPFYLWKTWGDLKKKGAVATLWPWVPIVLFVGAYFDKLNLPRYIIYVAPFMIYMLYETAVFAIWKLKVHFALFRGSVALALLVGVLLFNPYFHIQARNASSDNIIERFSLNYSERNIYSGIHTGLLPLLNFTYKRLQSKCVGYLVHTIKDFLSSDKKALAFFGYGGLTENLLHLLVYRLYFEHFGIEYGEKSYGINNPIKVIRTRYMVPGTHNSGYDALRFRYRDKNFFLMKMRGPMHVGASFIYEEQLLRWFLYDARNEDIRFDDFQKIISYNFRVGPYPEYLRKENHCWIREPYTVPLMSVGFPDSPPEALKIFTQFPPPSRSPLPQPIEASEPAGPWASQLERKATR